MPIPGRDSARPSRGSRLPAVKFMVAMLVCLNLAGQSLYKEETYRALAADRKAFRVGDIITIQVYENSSASTTTDTTTQRNNSLSAGITSTSSGRGGGGGISAGSSFDGGGTTQRTNRLLATVSAGVRELMPNGDLKVAGEQLLTVNGEQHKVHIEGRVRPQDISSDNVVLSTRMADARINYVGKGELSERQQRAWWRALLDGLGL